jgi:hypothetical protein
MKKATFLAASLALAVTFGLAGTANAGETCDLSAGNEAVDIDTLTARYDAGTDEIIVEMLRCDTPDPDNAFYNFNVYIDHTYPFFDDPDRNGDGVVDSYDSCYPTDDTKMSQILHRVQVGFTPLPPPNRRPIFGLLRNVTGPGLIDEVDETLTFTVDVDDLNPSLALGDTVFIWAIARKTGGIEDQVPAANDGDGCREPEVATEVLALTLEVACPCFADVTAAGPPPYSVCFRDYDAGGTVENQWRVRSSLPPSYYQLSAYSSELDPSRHFCFKGPPWITIADITEAEYDACVAIISDAHVLGGCTACYGNECPP